jgi:hypothetical protein
VQARSLSGHSVPEDVVASNLPRNMSMDTAAVQLELQQRGLAQLTTASPLLQRTCSDRISPRLSPRASGNLQQPESPGGGGGGGQPAVPLLTGLSRLARTAS